MVRPTIYEDLTTTSITVEHELLRKAKANGINISGICRDALRSATNSPGSAKRSRPRKKPTRYDRAKKLLRKKGPVRMKEAIQEIMTKMGLPSTSARGLLVDMAAVDMAEISRGTFRVL